MEEKLDKFTNQLSKIYKSVNKIIVCLVILILVNKYLIGSLFGGFFLVNILNIVNIVCGIIIVIQPIIFIVIEILGNKFVVIRRMSMPYLSMKVFFLILVTSLYLYVFMTPNIRYYNAAAKTLMNLPVKSTLGLSPYDLEERSRYYKYPNVDIYDENTKTLVLISHDRIIDIDRMERYAYVYSKNLSGYSKGDKIVVGGSRYVLEKKVGRNWYYVYSRG